MQTKNILLVLLLATSIIACKQANLKYDKPYFDFDSLVNIQIKKISNTKDSVRKDAVIDGKQDHSSFVIDSTRLAHEWDVFRQLDVINKPLYKGNYEITEGKDTKSNLQVRTYQSKIKSPVPYLRFYFHNSFQNLKKIESNYQEENALYFTKRDLMMVLDDQSGEPLIKSYSITGSQKMILSDSVKFSIHGSIGAKVDPDGNREQTNN
jgi:hypothetical protein